MLRLFKYENLFCRDSIGIFVSIERNVKADLWVVDKNRLFKKRAKYYLDRDLVHCVASDMHHLSKRPAYMKEAFEIISHKYGLKKANELFVENPNRIVTNQMIE